MAVTDALQDVRVAFVVANEGIEEVELLRPWQAVMDAGGRACRRGAGDTGQGQSHTFQRAARRGG